jgi:hypothetical protein
MLAGCASDVEPSDESRAATVSEPIQLIDFLAGQAALAQDNSTASHATGALYVPFLNADHSAKIVVASTFPLLRIYPVRGTCGVTFISPHYAITASHCVADVNAYDPANQTFAIRQFDITAANGTSLLLDSDLSGTFPNFTGTPASTVPGYNATALSCKIVSRCAFSNASDYNCGTSADVTMLYCGNRAATAPWLGVAPSDPGTGPVEMYWFHEVVNAPLDAGSATTPTGQSLVPHYTNLTPGNEQNNWHYIGAPTNVLLPLKSINWPNGAAHKRVSPGTTDLFGCHGTSGSGVLQRNASGNLELLGPVHTGASWANNKLCNDPITAQPGAFSITYTPTSQVQYLTTKFSRSLLLDRSAIWLPPTAPIVREAR